MNLKKFRTGSRNIFGIFRILWAYKNSGMFFELVKNLVRNLAIAINDVLAEFEESSQALSGRNFLDHPKMSKARARVFGLHSLLPRDVRFSYSVLIQVTDPNLEYLEKALQSALDQTPPQLEVILGFEDEKVAEAAKGAVVRLRSNAQYDNKLKVVILKSINETAKAAQNHFLFILNQNDWIRPDLLYRFELALRLLKNPENTVLYCNEYQIRFNDGLVPQSTFNKPESIVFPYFFKNLVGSGFLISNDLWKKTGGIRSDLNEAQLYDFFLRLDLQGASFQNVPFEMYARRQAPIQSTQTFEKSLNDATTSGVRALTEYSELKKLDWTIELGNELGTLRAIPRKQEVGMIHVIIPFRDQKELTLSAIHSVLAQKGVQLLITAVDNGSSDFSIGSALESLGVEVLRMNEPFNFSRINNRAVKESRFAAQCETLLFLNNDVILEVDAIEEMVRWIDQPKVGVVGALLYYPDHRIQHGGVRLALEQGPANRMTWHHIGGGQPADSSGSHQVISICDAVTAACALVKKEVFFKVNGFDEIWYPIAFSDTDLAIKIKKLGLYPLYTPYARGIHYESISRGPGVWEESEASIWHFRNTESREQPKDRLEPTVFFR